MATRTAVPGSGTAFCPPLSAAPAQAAACGSATDEAKSESAPAPMVKLVPTGTAALAMTISVSTFHGRAAAVVVGSGED